MLLVLLAVLATASCGGSNAGLALPPAGDGQPGTEVPADAMDGLPGISELYEAGRSVSATDSGWFDLNLAQTALVDRSSGVSLEQAGLRFEAGDTAAWQLWGIHGFRGLMQPTACSVDVSAVNGEFYIGLADFAGGRWRFAGPYSESTVLDYEAELGKLVNDDENHYLALLVPAGSSLLLESAAIGLSGHNLAPQPAEMFLTPGDGLVQVNWTLSPDHHKIGFAGYSVERAPSLDGEFTALHAELLQGTSYIDNDVQNGEFYRYRVRFHGSDGLSSLSAVHTGGPDPNGNARPVCLLEMTQGPLLGPAEVTLDLSASFDPEGEELTEYSFYFGSFVEPVVQSSPVLTTMLQPGCYSIFCTVSDGSLTGFANALLKVHPDWQSESTELIGAKRSTSRFRAVSAEIFEPDNTLCTLYYDLSSNDLELRVEDADGNAGTHVLRADTERILRIGQACMFQDKLCFPVYSQSGHVRFVSWSGSELSYLAAQQIENVGYLSKSYLIPVGNRLLFLHAVNLPGHIDVVANDLSNGNEYTLATGIDGELVAGANPKLQCFDIAYVENQNGHWIRFDQQLEQLDTEVFAFSGLANAALQADPLTGDMYFFAPFVNYMELRILDNESETWSMPFDPPCYPAYDFVPRIYFGAAKKLLPIMENSTTLRFYELDAGTYAELPPLSENSLIDVFRLSPSLQDDSVRMLDFLSTQDRIVVADIASDGSVAPAYTVSNTGAFGFQLQAACDDERLYVVYNGAYGNKLVSSSDALVWTDPLDLGSASDMSLASDGQSVFLSLAGQSHADFKHVSLGGIAPVSSDVTFNSFAFPILASGSRALWLCDRSKLDDSLTGADSFATPYQTTTDAANIWRGALAADADWSGIVMHGGDGISDIHQISHLIGQDGSSSALFQAPEMLSRNDQLDGRRFAAAWFRDSTTQFGASYYVADGVNGNALRIVFRDGVLETTELPLQAGDQRRSVSAALVSGDTSLGLVADNNGDDVLLEWDDYGDFEKLSLPDTGWSNLHVIAIGPDGRWHLVYHDIASDTLRIWSTN